jgi:integrase
LKPAACIEFTDKETAVVNRLIQSVRLKHYAYSTERTYAGWFRRYLVWLRTVDRALTSEKKVEGFLTWLAKDRDISGTTQDQALDALRFAYAFVFEKPLGNVHALRAKKNRHIRVAPTFQVTKEFLADVPNLFGYPTKLVGYIAYGSGLRVGEVVGLRIKDVDIENSRFILRGTKGRQDRLRPIPCNLMPHIKRQIAAAKSTWEEAQRRGVPTKLPEGLGAKYPGAQFSFRWFWLFPMRKPSPDPRTRKPVWWHLLTAQVQKAFRAAAEIHGYVGEITPHVMRHAWATHEYHRNHDIVAIKEGLGHKSLETTSVYLHASMEAGCPVEEMEISLSSPAA